MRKQIDFENFVKDFARDELEKELERYKYAGKAAMKEIREGITAKWFGDYNQESLDDATVYNVRTRFFDNLTASITVHSYVDIGKYKEKPSAQAWVNKHGGDIDPEEYVLQLQMTQGIIGLPQFARRYEERTYRKYNQENNWKNGRNLHFVRQKPALRDTIFNNANWSGFASKVASLAKR